MWHNYGMARIRVGTTVDERLIEAARGANPNLRDSALIDAALEALVARSRAAEIDSAYNAYDTRSMDQPNAWGDLKSFREAAARS